MELMIAIGLALFTGAATAAQGPTNAALGKVVGAVQASLVSFAGGMVILLAYGLITGTFSFEGAAGSQWWMYLGGPYAAFIVFSMAYATPILGNALTLTLLMLGQFSGALVVDGFGLLGAQAVPISGMRVAGCIMALLGILVVYAGQKRQEDAAALRVRGSRRLPLRRANKGFQGEGETEGKLDLAEASAGIGAPDAESASSHAVSDKGKAELLFMGISFLGGVASAVQTPTNAALSNYIGVMMVSTVSFLVGFAVLLIVSLVMGKGRLRSMRGIAPWKFTGGVYGAFGVPALTAATPVLGVSLALCCLMTAQLVGGLLVDSRGWFQVRRIAVDRMRIAGALLLALGVVLVCFSKL